LKGRLPHETVELAPAQQGVQIVQVLDPGVFAVKSGRALRNDEGL